MSCAKCKSEIKLFLRELRIHVHVSVYHSVFLVLLVFTVLHVRIFVVVLVIVIVNFKCCSVNHAAPGWA